LAAAQTADVAAEGLKALDARQYDTAIALFTEAVAADPKDYSAHFNLGLAYSLAGRDAQAIPEYKAVLELQPDVFEAQLNLGISLLNVKDAAAAVPYLRTAREKKPQEFRPVFYLAEALRESGKFSEAASAYQAALAIDAQSAAAEAGLGQALARQGLRTEADPHYRKAVTLDPAYKDVLIDLASLYEENKQPQQAIDLYRQFPENPGAQERIGVLLLRAGQTKEAIEALESAVAKSPSAANRLALAQAYTRDKQPAKAEPLAAEAAAAEPQDFDLRLFYARLLRDQRKFPEAARQFQAASQLQPDSAEAWSELAGVLILIEQYPAALDALNSIRALGAEKPGHFFIRAITLDRLEQDQEALESYQKFLAMSQGENPDQEFQARQRIRVLDKKR
jgi:tetratricopeptide (TPR) repeat protein